MRKKRSLGVLLAVGILAVNISLSCVASQMQPENQEVIVLGESSGAESERIDLSQFCNDVGKSEEFAAFVKNLDETKEKTLVIPEGKTLVLNRYFTVPSNTTLTGGAIEFTADAKYANVYNEAFILNRHSETYWDGKADENIRIENVAIRYDCSQNGHSLLRFRNISHLAVTNCDIRIINQQKTTVSHNAAIDLFKGCSDVELSNNQIYLDNPNGSAGGAIWIRSMAVANNDSDLLKTHDVRVTGNVITSNSCDELLAVGSSGYDTSDVLVSGNTFIRLEGSKKNLMLGVCPAIGGNISNVSIKDNAFRMNNTCAVMNKEILRIGGVLDTNQYPFNLTGIEVSGNEISGILSNTKAIVVKKEETNGASVLLKENKIVNTGENQGNSFGIIATGPNILVDNIVEGVETAFSTDSETVWNHSDGETGLDAKVVKRFLNVQEMKSYGNADGVLKEGVYVRTSGYYTNQDGGGALYLILKDTTKTADDRKVIALNSGFRAILVMEKDTVNVKQFGARSDGSQDAHDAIYAAVTSGAKTIVFQKGDYKIDNYLFFMNVDGITIEGNGSTLFTDNDYRKGMNYEEHFITFSGENYKRLKNITINNLNIEAREQLKSSSEHKYKNQLAFKYVDQVSLSGCELRIPETTTASLTEKNFEYSCLDFYVGWSNVNVENCRIMNQAGVRYGVCVQFRDIWNGGCENAKFHDNYLYSNSKDEIIAIFANESSNSHVNNVNIYHNEIIADRCELIRDICMTVGYDTSYQCDNIQIHDNKITGVSDWGMFTLGKTLTNSKIYNNTVVARTQRDVSGATKIGLVRTQCSNNTNEVSNNHFTIEAYEGTGAAVLFDGNCNYLGNTVISQEKVNTLFSGAGNSENNKIKIYNQVVELGYNAAAVKENDIYIQGNLTKTGFNYYGSVWQKNCEVSDNQITIEGSSVPATFLQLNSTTLNGKEFIFKNNTINTPNCKENKVLLYLNLKDTTPQKIFLLNNKQGIYSGEMKAANQAEHQIIYEKKEETPPSSEEENSEEISTKEENSEESSEEVSTKEDPKKDNSEEVSTKEDPKKDNSEEVSTKEDPKKDNSEEVSTKEDPKKDNNEEVSTKEDHNKNNSENVSTREENKKGTNSVHSTKENISKENPVNKTTRKEPFNEVDTKRDPFTVADTGKNKEEKKQEESIAELSSKEESTDPEIEKVQEETKNESEIAEKKPEEVEASVKQVTAGNSSIEKKKDVRIPIILGVAAALMAVSSFLFLSKRK